MDRDDDIVDCCQECGCHINHCPNCGKSGSIDIIDCFDRENGDPALYMFRCISCNNEWYQIGYYGNPITFQEILNQGW